MQKTQVQVISENVSMEFVAEGGETTPIATQFIYNPADPFAVTVRFGTDDEVVEWTFGRELLTEGLYEPTGDGDIHVWPCLSAAGSAVVILELASPGGSVMLQVETRPLHGFTAAMVDMVALGSELDQIDLDDEIQALLSA